MDVLRLDYFAIWTFWDVDILKFGASRLGSYEILTFYNQNVLLQLDWFETNLLGAAEYTITHVLAKNHHFFLSLQASVNSLNPVFRKKNRSLILAINIGIIILVFIKLLGT